MHDHFEGLKPKQFYSMTSNKHITNFTKPEMIALPKKHSCGINLKKRKPKGVDDELCEEAKKEMIVNEELGDYEKMIKKNIEERMAFFASLNFDEVKQEIQSFAPVKKTRLVQNREKPVLLPPTRKSLRLQNRAADETWRLNKTNHECKQPKLHEHFPFSKELKNEKNGHLPFSEVFKHGKISESSSFSESLKFLPNESFVSKPIPFDRYEKCFKSMKISKNLVGKVCPSVIFSLTIHPTTSKTLIAAGDRNGHVGFWDVGSNIGNLGVCMYEPHSAPVSCLAFNTNKPWEVISTSYDGTVRCGNFEKAVFDLCSAHKDYEVRLTSFDFLSPHSILVSQSNGKGSIVDTRTITRLKAEAVYDLHSCIIKTVSVHPTRKNFFIAACRDGTISLWDLRQLKKFPVAEFNQGRCVSSAYFSPVTGNSILTTSLDNKLSIFDSCHLNQAMEKKTSLWNNNITGRWLSCFRAVWLPGNEDAFVVGSIAYPRRIEVFTTTGTLLHEFTGEDLQSVCAINAFHPSKQILAGGNANGKVHIFQEMAE